MVPGLQDHPAEPRVHRQPGELPPQGGELGGAAPGCQGAEFFEQPYAIGDVAGLRRVHEREVRDLAQVERGRLQDDRGQVGAQDLRVGELGACGEVLLGVQPDADAVRGAATPALALVGRGTRDRLDGQSLHLGPLAVPGDPRRARVDHVLDARHGQRGLGDVGGQHHAGPPVRLEHPVLLGRGQPRVQRQHLKVAEVWAVGERVGGVPDLPFTAEEDQDIPGPFGAQFRERVADALDLVFRLLAWTVRIGKGPVADLDRVHPAGHLDDRRISALLA